MGVTYGIVSFASGRRISTHWPAAGVVGTYIPMSGNEKALATSSEEYTISGGDDVIVDVSQGPATGTIQFEINGNPIHSMCDMSMHSPTNVGRPRLNIPVSNGERVKLKVVSELAA